MKVILKISNTGKEGEDSATDLIMNGSKTMIQLITDIHTIDLKVTDFYF